MNLYDLLELLSTVAFGLAAVSGLILILAKQSDAPLNSLYRARISVHLQLTTVALILGILPMVFHYVGYTDVEMLQMSSTTMAVMIAISMLLARRTYAMPRSEFADSVTIEKKLLFHGPLGMQLLLAATVGAGFWEVAAAAIYCFGLVLLLGLAALQLLRFLQLEEWS